jgi:hypothetical protein
MLKSISSIVNGINKWYVKEIATLDWKLMLATPFVGKIIQSYINKNKELIDMALNEDGLIDVDSLYEQYKNLLETSGKSNIEIYGVKLNKEDLDKLYEFIKKE